MQSENPKIDGSVRYSIFLTTIPLSNKSNNIYTTRELNSSTSLDWLLGMKLVFYIKRTF